MEKIQCGCDKRGRSVEVGEDVKKKTGGGCGKMIEVVEVSGEVMEKRGRGCEKGDEGGDETKVNWSGCRGLGGTLHRKRYIQLSSANYR